MSIERRRALAVRQRLLLVRSTETRAELATQAAVLRTPLALADMVVGAWRWLQAHPQLPLAAGAVLLVLRPRRVFRWGMRGWWAWRQFQRLQGWVVRRL